jgi:hypothetical protein
MGRAESEASGSVHTTMIWAAALIDISTFQGGQTHGHLF